MKAIISKDDREVGTFDFTDNGLATKDSQLKTVMESLLEHGIGVLGPGSAPNSDEWKTFKVSPEVSNLVATTLEELGYSVLLSK